MIDALAVHKDANGEIEVQHLSNLTKEQAIETGSVIGALIGLGIDGEEGAEAGALLGAEAAAEGENDPLGGEGLGDVEEIPNDSAAAVILLEHHWAVPLRDAVARAGGFRISDGFIHPLDLVETSRVRRRQRPYTSVRPPTRSGNRPTQEGFHVRMPQSGSPHIPARSAPTLAKRSCSAAARAAEHGNLDPAMGRDRRSPLSGEVSAAASR